PLSTGTSAPPTTVQSLCQIDSDSPMPFVINEVVAADLIKADNELAADALAKIKQDMTELVTHYPNSPAATEVSAILDKAGLKVIPGFGVYSKDVFCITIPITR
ncbi:MAG: hypothetical protein KDA86_27620, partial [Planctomycetaceae bacterium]|nr:hypothetical protein [Planctomycetaceae bacterium]